MSREKFILAGGDKKTLAYIKKVLAASGYIFIGYSKEPYDMLRHIRSRAPDLVIIEVSNNLAEFRSILQVIDEELLAACILVLETKNDEVLNLLRDSRVMTCITKPIFEEVVVQVAEIVLLNHRRLEEYEQKVKKLNEILESRKVVERAKWILVERQNITEAEALEIIRRKSRDKRRPMKEIAEAIILAQG